MHGGKARGAPMANSHALKHGHYSQETIERRRETAAMIRAMKALVRNVVSED